MSVTSRILEQGSNEQKQCYLPLLSSGTWLAASSWSERGAGANKQKISTTGTLLESNTWNITGEKAFTTGAGLADLYLVLVQTSVNSNLGLYGNPGQSFFLIESTSPGIKANSNLNLTGMRGSSTGFIELENCLVSSKNMLGSIGEAADIIASIRNSGLSLGAVSIGIAEAAFDIALEHLEKRALLDQPTIQFRLTELNMLLEAAKSLVERAARKEAPNLGVVTYQSKIFASEVSEKICREAQQIVGGMGFIRGNQIEKLARDARAIALMGPVNELAREIIGREIIA
jgi:alkylation response protein AidB-like acyl-CoA dehydrogenase